MHHREALGAGSSRLAGDHDLIRILIRGGWGYIPGLREPVGWGPGKEREWGSSAWPKGEQGRKNGLQWEEGCTSALLREQMEDFLRTQLKGMIA